MIWMTSFNATTVGCNILINWGIAAVIIKVSSLSELLLETANADLIE